MSPSIQLICAPANAAPATDDLPHILLVVDQFSRTLGGGERVLLRQASLLPAMGFRVSILTLSLDPESPVLAMDPPCPIYLLPLNKTYDWHALKAALALRRFLIEQNVRLVQTFFESSDLWVGSIAKTIPGMALIWSRRDLGILRDAKHRIAYRLLARMPDRVFAVSEQVRQHVLKVDHAPADRVLTLYNGVEVPAALPMRELDPDSLHITSTGNLRPVKGFDLLIEAAAVLIARYPAIHFSIAGSVLDQQYAKTLEARCVALGICDQVKFLGHVGAMSDHLRSADIFVLPSRSEGFSNAILEAMAVGVPVVATDVGGNAEAVEHERSGLIVASEDVGAIVGALEQLIGDPELRRQLGRNAFEAVHQRFSIDAMMAATTVQYRDLLKHRSQHHPSFGNQSN